MKQAPKKTNMIFENDLAIHVLDSRNKKAVMEFKKGDIINPEQLQVKRNLSNHVNMTAKEPTVKIEGYSVLRLADLKKLEEEKLAAEKKAAKEAEAARKKAEKEAKEKNKQKNTEKNKQTNKQENNKPKKS